MFMPEPLYSRCNFSAPATSKAVNSSERNDPKTFPSFSLWNRSKLFAKRVKKLNKMKFPHSRVLLIIITRLLKPARLHPYGLAMGPKFIGPWKSKELTKRTTMLDPTRQTSIKKNPNKKKMELHNLMNKVNSGSWRNEDYIAADRLLLHFFFFPLFLGLTLIIRIHHNHWHCQVLTFTFII